MSLINKIRKNKKRERTLNFVISSIEHDLNKLNKSGLVNNQRTEQSVMVARINNLFDEKLKVIKKTIAFDRQRKVEIYNSMIMNQKKVNVA
jgi:hypothetical protein